MIEAEMQELQKILEDHPEREKSSGEKGPPPIDNGKAPSEYTQWVVLPNSTFAVVVSLSAGAGAVVGSASHANAIDIELASVNAVNNVRILNILFSEKFNN